jgi:hypothetical protein
MDDTYLQVLCTEGHLTEWSCDPATTLPVVPETIIPRGKLPCGHTPVWVNIVREMDACLTCGEAGCPCGRVPLAPIESGRLPYTCEACGHAGAGRPTRYTTPDAGLGQHLVPS